MPLLAKSTIFVLTLMLLVACANTQEKELKRSAAEANFKLGVGYMQSGHLEVASEKLLKALQYDDNYPEAHNAIGVLYEEMREYAPAETHFKEAIAIKSDYTLAKLNYARLLCKHFPERAAEGESEFQKIATDPANAGAVAADAYAGLGVCTRTRGDLAQAEVLLRKALDSDPNNTTALYELAEISQTQNKTMQGRAFLQRYHAQTHATPQSLWLGILIETAGDGDAHLRQQYIALLSGRFPNSEEARRLNKSE